MAGKRQQPCAQVRSPCPKWTRVPHPSSMKESSFSEHLWEVEEHWKAPREACFRFPWGGGHVKGKNVQHSRRSLQNCTVCPGLSSSQQPQGQKAPLTAGKEDQASLLGAKMVKLPGPSISGLSFSVRSVYSCVVVDPTTPRVSYRFESGRAVEAEDRGTGVNPSPTHTCLQFFVRNDSGCNC